MNNKNKQSNQVSHPLRIIAGIYLLYLAQSLLKKWAELDNQLLFAVFIGIFGVIGILLLVTSGLALLRDWNNKNNAINTPGTFTEDSQQEDSEAHSEDSKAQLHDSKSEETKEDQSKDSDL